MIRVPKWFALVAIFLVLALAAPALAEEAQGKIKIVIAEGSEFVITNGDGADVSFKLAADGKVFIDGKQASLSDLKEQDEVKVTWEEKDDQKMASEVRCQRLRRPFN